MIKVNKMNVDNMMNLADLVADNESLRPLMDITDQIMSLSEESLTPTMIESLRGAINGAFTEEIKNNSVQMMINEFKERGLSRAQARDNVNDFKAAVKDYIEVLQPSEKKKQVFDSIFDLFYELFDSVLEHYLSYDIVLPITLEEGAQVPTYAHETDAAADLYAADTITIPAHSLSTMVRTGVHIALPEGWMAIIEPRSSIGAKTPLRLSNAQGIIDSGYRGQLGVLYDNLSNSDYTINAGDRIAQLMIRPTYKFKADVVPFLSETDRGEGGFGSSGK